MSKGFAGSIANGARISLTAKMVSDLKAKALLDELFVK
jgi:hypothetical protein